MEQRIVVIIPAFNEENAVGVVINEIPKDLVSEIIVVDNGSLDDTFDVAQGHGATALLEPQKGYGQACLSGIKYLQSQKLEGQPTDIVVFLDGDHSDYPEEMINLIRPIRDENMDLVIGSRALGKRQKGSMTVPQTFGNWLATTLLKWLYGVKFTDLGPFRAIKYERLMEMDMQDKTFGWTVEMQLKAAKLKMKTTEVPVNYRVRIGKSKISGTVRGTLMAGYKILQTIFKYL